MMNTVQISNHFRLLESDKKELKEILEMLADNGYKGSKAYYLIQDALDEKIKEYNLFAKKVWVDE